MTTINTYLNIADTHDDFLDFFNNKPTEAISILRRAINCYALMHTVDDPEEVMGYSRLYDYYIIEYVKFLATVPVAARLARYADHFLPV